MQGKPGEIGEFIGVCSVFVRMFTFGIATKEIAVSVPRGTNAAERGSQGIRAILNPRGTKMLGKEVLVEIEANPRLG